jgi:hypothetical protein
MKLVAFGVVDAIIAVVLELGGAIAGVLDAVAGLFGKSTQNTVASVEFQYRQLAVDGTVLASPQARRCLHAFWPGAASRMTKPVPAHRSARSNRSAPLHALAEPGPSTPYD